MINEKVNELNQRLTSIKKDEFDFIPWGYIKTYLGNSISTGGSDWHKYMHPKYRLIGISCFRSATSSCLSTMIRSNILEQEIEWKKNFNL